MLLPFEGRQYCGQGVCIRVQLGEHFTGTRPTGLLGVCLPECGESVFEFRLVLLILLLLIVLFVLA